MDTAIISPAQPRECLNTSESMMKAAGNDGQERVSRVSSENEQQTWDLKPSLDYKRDYNLGYNLGL